MKENHHIALYSLFLVLFIDGMGQGILFPILAGAVLSPHTTILLTASASLASRDFWYGIILSSFSLMWFFAAPILSDFSDSKGRKITLSICLLGSIIGYLLSALSFILHSLAIMIIGRLIDGLTAGGQSIAQAAVIDMSANEQEKNKNIAYVLMSLTIGLIIGPVLGGYLSSQTLVSWFDFTTPMYFSMLIGIVNFILLQVYFKEKKPHRQAQRLSVLRAIKVFFPVFRHKNLRRLMMYYLLIQLGWSLYYVYLTLFVTRFYHFSPEKTALAFSVLGGSLTLGFLFLVKAVDGLACAKRLSLIGFSIVAVCILGVVISHAVSLLWLSIIIIGMAFTVGYTFLINLFSNQVGLAYQGWVMGISGSVVPLAGFITSILSGWLPQIGLQIPMLIAFILVAVGCLFFYFYQAIPNYQHDMMDDDHKLK